MTRPLRLEVAGVHNFLMLVFCKTKMKPSDFLFLMALVIVPLSGNSKPGPITEYLLKEPASMFDIGILRLRSDTHVWSNWVAANYHRQAKTGERAGDVNIGYKRKSDRFTASFSVTDVNSNSEQMESGCRAALGYLRLYVIKSLPGAFMHWGTDNPNQPVGFAESLINQFDFSCRVSDYQGEARFKSGYSGREQEMIIEEVERLPAIPEGK